MSDNAYEKNNTFSKSPAAAQIFSYCIFVAEISLFYAVILPNLEDNQIVYAVIFSISLFIMVITTIICSVIDPSDKAMILCRNDRE